MNVFIVFVSTVEIFFLKLLSPFKEFHFNNIDEMLFKIVMTTEWY